MPLYEYRCETCGQQYESYKRLTAKGASPGTGSSCGGGPRRSPFG